MKPAHLLFLGLIGPCAFSCGGTPAIADAGNAVDTAGELSPSGDVSDTTPVPESCVAQSTALAVALHAMAGAKCTVVVRLDYDTRAVLGYQLVCGQVAAVDENQARATAAADTGLAIDPTQVQSLTPPNPVDEFVFYKTPGDSGATAAVSARNGLTVFGGTVVFAGRGDITFPKDWRPASELGTNCLPAEGIPSFRGWEVGATATQASLSSAVDVVKSTAIPSAMWRSGRVIDAVVLAYARSVGLVSQAPVNFASAEWIVLVNGE